MGWGFAPRSRLAVAEEKEIVARDLGERKWFSTYSVPDSGRPQVSPAGRYGFIDLSPKIARILIFINLLIDLTYIYNQGSLLVRSLLQLHFLKAQSGHTKSWPWYRVKKNYRFGAGK